MELPISAEKLAKRWGLKPIDLFFIMWNHDLKVLTQNGNLIGVDEALGAIPQESRDKRLAMEDWYFSLNQVDTLEKAYVGDLLSKNHKVVRGQHLIDKWDMDDFALHTIVSQKGWDFVDPFGQTIGGAFFLEMCAHGNFNISEAWFKKSDVEEFEKETVTIISNLVDPIKNRPVIAASNVLNEAILAVYFCRRGQGWLIGEKGSEKYFKHYVGFNYIKFLLRYPEERFDVIKVQYLGEVPYEAQHLLYQRRLNYYSNPKTKKKIMALRKRCQHRFRETENSEYKNELKIEIKQYDDFFKSLHSPNPDKEKIRTKIRANIKKAIDVIYMEARGDSTFEIVTKSLCLENPHKTIITGNSCCYRPNPSFPIQWILDSPSI